MQNTLEKPPSTPPDITQRYFPYYNSTPIQSNAQHGRSEHERTGTASQTAPNTVGKLGAAVSQKA